MQYHMEWDRTVIECSTYLVLCPLHHRYALGGLVAISALTLMLTLTLPLAPNCSLNRGNSGPTPHHDSKPESKPTPPAGWHQCRSQLEAGLDLAAGLGSWHNPNPNLPLWPGRT